MITMKISIRSRVLIAIGALHGHPKDWGLNCSIEEFYAMPNERPGISPEFLHPRKAQEFSVMERNVLVDRVRQRVFKQWAIAACVASIGIFSIGSVAVGTISKTKEIASSIKEKIENSKMNKERIEYLKELAIELNDKAKNGSITKEDYETKKKTIDDEYKELTK